MTARTEPPDPRRAQVRRLIADALLATASAAVHRGASPDDVCAALLATAVNFGLDVVPPHQVAGELRQLADEVEQLPARPMGRDNAPERPN